MPIITPEHSTIGHVDSLSLQEEKDTDEIATQPEDFPIIVIGASAGGFDAIRELMAGLPADLNAAILIVWHISSGTPGVLPSVINRDTQIPAKHPVNGERIMPGNIYVAPPDHHLLIDNGYIRLSRGPKENRFRPAVDPLFRSAAYYFDGRVTGVILTGYLDDGTSGLWTVKEYGGITIVQDPADAEVPAMPQNALREVQVDYCVPLSEMAALLVETSRKSARKHGQSIPENDVRTKMEIDAAAEKYPIDAGILDHGTLTRLTCPECNGVLANYQDGTLNRLRCHTGHAYSYQSIIAAQEENIEDNIYSTIQLLEELMMSLNQSGDHFGEINQPAAAADCFRRAMIARDKVGVLHSLIVGQINPPGTSSE